MNFTARKRFGQHFLHDPAVIGRIVDCIDPAADEVFVEIGPGTGAITRPLVERARRVIAIEIDRDLAGALSDQNRSSKNLVVHNTDALEFDFAAVAREQRLRIAGNLPYNISTPLLFYLLRFQSVIVDVHFMLQKEVVDRIVAAPGNKTYGRLTVMLAPYFESQRLFDIGPGAFQPAPRVGSTFMRLVPRSESWLDDLIRPAYARIVAEAFSHRRKTLRNALRRCLDEADIRSVNADPGARPETIDPETYARLARQLTLREGSG